MCTLRYNVVCRPTCNMYARTLGVAPADIQDNWIGAVTGDPSHLDVTDAVVDTDQRHVPHQRQRSRGNGTGAEGTAHPRSLGEGDAAQMSLRLGFVRIGLRQGRPYQRHDVILMMPRRLAGEEAHPRRTDVRLAGIGQRFVRVRIGIVLQDADANLVGRSLDAQDGRLVAVRIVRGLVLHLRWQR